LFLQNIGQSPLVLNAANTKISGDFSLQGLGNCSARDHGQRWSNVQYQHSLHAGERWRPVCHRKHYE
jgi:hypothetical protein